MDVLNECTLTAPCHFSHKAFSSVIWSLTPVCTHANTHTHVSWRSVFPSLNACRMRTLRTWHAVCPNSVHYYSTPHHATPSNPPPPHTHPPCSINMMKDGAILLNVSRGGLIDSDEVMAALERGKLGGVGLDVWENEAGATTGSAVHEAGGWFGGGGGLRGGRHIRACPDCNTALATLCAPCQIYTSLTCHQVSSGTTRALKHNQTHADLFFSDWTDMDLKTRMGNWDRRFKLLTSYPQVRLGQLSSNCALVCMWVVHAGSLSRYQCIS